MYSLIPQLFLCFLRLGVQGMHVCVLECKCMSKRDRAGVNPTIEWGGGFDWVRSEWEAQDKISENHMCRFWPLFQSSRTSVNPSRSLSVFRTISSLGSWGVTDWDIQGRAPQRDEIRLTERINFPQFSGSWRHPALPWRESTSACALFMLDYTVSVQSSILLSLHRCKHVERYKMWSF